MEIWLSDGNTDKLKIPVNPQSAGVDRTGSFEDVILANGDEKTVLGGKLLKTYSIDSYFPKVRPHFVAGTILTPHQYTNKIGKWMDEKKVLLYQVTTTNINTLVTIRSFSWKEVGGAVGDIEYTLELKEYKPVSYSKIKVVAPDKPDTKPSKRPPSSKPQAKSYTVKPGDSLWKIAKIVYGNGGLWQKIYAKNKSIIGPNPNLIKPGQKLVIP